MEEASAAKSWYKTGPTDIAVVERSNAVAPLSKYSHVIASMKSNNQVLLYAKPEDVPNAEQIIRKVKK